MTNPPAGGAVNPVKYVSPVGGFKPPTATNLLPPISSTALFNGVKNNYATSLM
ncbi:MAG: hypothetical protein U9R14_01085 [Patescibacteria group bacterium]|nr:hypothetical protein [Patescibacteria group bacterium]